MLILQGSVVGNSDTGNQWETLFNIELRAAFTKDGERARPRL